MTHIIIMAALLLAGLGCFASFSWGVKGHFRSTGKMPAGMKLVSLLSLIGFVIFGARILTNQPLGAVGLALALFAAALMLFAWTVSSTRRTPPTLAFDTDKPSFLLLHGPYQYVRHPFYLSYMLFWMGTAAAFAGLLAWLTPVVMLVVYQQAATREERKFAHSDFSNDYAAYQRRAGMFTPRASMFLTR